MAPARILHLFFLAFVFSSRYAAWSCLVSHYLHDRAGSCRGPFARPSAVIQHKIQKGGGEGWFGVHDASKRAELRAFLHPTGLFLSVRQAAFVRGKARGLPAHQGCGSDRRGIWRGLIFTVDRGGILADVPRPSAAVRQPGLPGFSSSGMHLSQHQHHPAFSALIHHPSFLCRLVGVALSAVRSLWKVARAYLQRGAFRRERRGGMFV